MDRRIMLIGSCFSENIFTYLSQRKFQVKSNPFGILFDSIAIETCIREIVNKKKYTSEDLFFFQEIYGSWHHHTSFSSTEKSMSLEMINESISQHYDYLQNLDTIIVTLGSAFSYYHIEEHRYVANCHKVPQSKFRKDLISTERIYESLENIKKLILSINSSCKIILTISPVRHLRDGVIENNRSKARLIEAVHRFVSTNENSYYFPSYEIVIDVLRDYRFFDIDFAHPNYLATDIVFDYFRTLCIEESCYEKMETFYQLYLAMNHKPRMPKTKEHRRFLEIHLSKAIAMQNENPRLDFSNEINYFRKGLDQLEIRS